MTEKKKVGRPPKTPRRRKRNIGEHRSRLETPDIPGYETRWVNDVKSRIHDFTVRDDWEFVVKEDITDEYERVSVGDPDKTNVLEPGEKVCRPVGQVDEIPNAKAYLLKKKKEYFWEDHKAVQDQIAEQEKQLYRPAIDERQGTLKISKQ